MLARGAGGSGIVIIAGTIGAADRTCGQIAAKLSYAAVLS